MLSPIISALRADLQTERGDNQALRDENELLKHQIQMRDEWLIKFTEYRVTDAAVAKAVQSENLGVALIAADLRDARADLARLSRVNEGLKRACDELKVASRIEDRSYRCQRTDEIIAAACAEGGETNG